MTELRRTLGLRDGVLITIGAVVGTGIFRTPADIATHVPSELAILAVWLAGGALTLAGALTYGELGALFPRAGGMYDFLKEAYGKPVGFLFGWASFLVIMSGGIAALGVSFGEFLCRVPPFDRIASPRGHAPQVIGAVTIALLTAINHFGVTPGVRVQNGLTILKVAALLIFAMWGLATDAPASAAVDDVESGAIRLGGLGLAMISVLWAYDGWYGAVFSAGEMKRPGRTLPLSLAAGTGIVIALYLLVNAAYSRALSPSQMAVTPLIGEAAAAALFGPGAARAMTVAILVAVFRCLATTILYSSRIYQPMSRDGVFFRSLAAVHPRSRAPVASLWAQSAWSIVLALSGTFNQLITCVIVASMLFHAATAAAVFVLRRKRPGLERPYRVIGYPFVPAVFIGGCLLILGNSLVEQPAESGTGLGLVLLGLPAYAWWSRGASLRRAADEARDREPRDSERRGHERHA